LNPAVAAIIFSPNEPIRNVNDREYKKHHIEQHHGETAHRRDPEF